MLGGAPLYLSKEVCFGDHQNSFGIDVDNLLEHLPLPKEYIFSIKERDEQFTGYALNVLFSSSSTSS